MGLEGHTYALRCESGLCNSFKCSVCLGTQLCWNVGASSAVSSTLLILGKEAPNPCLATVAGKHHLPKEGLGMLDLPCVVSRCGDVPKEVGICDVQSSSVTLDSCFLPQVGDTISLNTWCCCGLVIGCESQCPGRAFLGSNKISAICCQC